MGDSLVFELLAEIKAIEATTTATIFCIILFMFLTFFMFYPIYSLTDSSNPKYMEYSKRVKVTIILF